MRAWWLSAAVLALATAAVFPQTSGLMEQAHSQQQSDAMIEPDVLDALEQDAEVAVLISLPPPAASLADVGLTEMRDNTAEGQAQDPQPSSYTVTIESVSVAVGDTGSVNVEMVDISGPQIAWDARITYDLSIVSVVECIAVGDSTCDPAYRGDAVRVLGLNEAGLAQDSVLASITFRCESTGDTALTVTSQLLTIEQGPRIETRDGVIVCQDAAEPDGSASPPSTVEPTLPAMGGGAPSDNPLVNRFIYYALMATAVALLAATGAIRVRAGHS